MPEGSLLQDLLILFGLSVMAAVAVHRLKLPAIFGFLLTGIICGPYGFGLIAASHEVEAIAEVGVVLLLFTVGIEFSIQHLMRLRTFLLAGGGLQVTLTLLATTLVTRGLGLDWSEATFFGMLVSLSSTAIVMRLLSERGEVETPHGSASLGILIFQDLCIVPMMLVTPILGGAMGGDTGSLSLITLKSLLFIGLAVIAAHYVVPWLLHQVVRTRRREVFLLTIIFLCLGTAWATAQIGLSLALGAFVAGLIVSESEYSHQALSEVLPFREVFNSLFFVSIGMLFDTQTLMQSPGLVVGGIIGVIVVKSLLAGGVTWALGYPMRVALVTGIGLAQIGEFSFVLSRVGIEVELLDAKLNQIFLAVAVGTMALTPGLIAAGPKVALWLEKRLGGKGEKARGTKLAAGALAEKKLNDHVIIIGYGLVGRNLARVLSNVEIPYVVIEMNPETLRSERKKGTPIHYGDASRPEVLRKARIDHARVVVIAISDAAATRLCTDNARRLNPAAHIIVRSRFVKEIEALVAIGASDVVPEEFETSVEIFARVLRTYLAPRDVIERCIESVRQDGYEMFRSLDERHFKTKGLDRFLSGMSLEDFRVEEGSRLEGKSLAESRLRKTTGVTVLAIQHPEGGMAVNPDSSEVMRRDDRVVVIGAASAVAGAGTLFRAGEKAQGESPGESEETSQ
ncbi:MAG: cation:proton antiporter [bacterium]